MWRVRCIDLLGACGRVHERVYLQLLPLLVELLNVYAYYGAPALATSTH